MEIETHQPNGHNIVIDTKLGGVEYNVFKIIDPRVDMAIHGNPDKSFIVYQGAEHWDKKETPCDYYTGDQIKWSNIKTAGISTYLDRKWWLEYVVKVSFTNFPWPAPKYAVATKANETHEAGILFHKDNVAIPGLLGFRPYPLAQCMDTIEMRINNCPFTCHPRETIKARMEYWDPEPLKECCGFCPHVRANAQDFWQETKEKGNSPFVLLGENENQEMGNSVIYEIQMAEFKTCQDIHGNSAADFTGTIQDKPAYISLGTANFWIKIREPLMADPLDYFSYAGPGSIIWQIENIDIDIKYSDLRRMLYINPAVLYNICEENYWYDGSPLCVPDASWGQAGKNQTYCKEISEISKYAANRNWLNEYLSLHFDDIVNVTLDSQYFKPRLVWDVATPTLPPELTCRLKYMFYELKEEEIKNPAYIDFFDGETARYGIIGNHLTEATYTTTSVTYYLNYVPKEIILWVAPSKSWLLTASTSRKCTIPDTFAQIQSIEIDFGTYGHILQHYDMKDLFLMCKRNGLKNRYWSDWNLCPRTFYQADVAKLTKAEDLRKLHKQYHIGVGSCVKLLPGLDFNSHGNLSLTGGVKTDSEGITFRVKWKPLLYTENKVAYSLYLLFDDRRDALFNNRTAVFVEPHLESITEVAAATPIRGNNYKDHDEVARAAGYGGSFFQKVKNFASNANKFLRNTHLISKIGSVIPHPIAQKIGATARTLGYGYGRGGGGGCPKVRGGKIIPPGAFYDTY